MTSDLIKRLEAEPEGSRELSLEAVASFDGHQNQSLACAILKSPKAYESAMLTSSLWVTQSIDAALTLVPEGWGWTVSVPQNVDKQIPKLSSEWETAQLWKHVDGKDLTVFSVHKHPALALCIAALKAKEAEDG